jgi:hypothetical protein
MEHPPSPLLEPSADPLVDSIESLSLTNGETSGDEELKEAIRRLSVMLFPDADDVEDEDNTPSHRTSDSGETITAPGADGRVKSFAFSDRNSQFEDTASRLRRLSTLLGIPLDPHSRAPTDVYHDTTVPQHVVDDQPHDIEAHELARRLSALVGEAAADNMFAFPTLSTIEETPSIYAPPTSTPKIPRPRTYSRPYDLFIQLVSLAWTYPLPIPSHQQLAITGSKSETNTQPSQTEAPPRRSYFGLQWLLSFIYTVPPTPAPTPAASSFTRT